MMNSVMTMTWSDSGGVSRCAATCWRGALLAARRMPRSPCSGLTARHSTPATYGTLLRSAHRTLLGHLQYNNAFRSMLRLPWRCSASGMFALNRVNDFFAVMRNMRWSFEQRAKASTNNIIYSVYHYCYINDDNFNKIIYGLFR